MSLVSYCSSLCQSVCLSNTYCHTSFLPSQLWGGDNRSWRCIKDDGTVGSRAISLQSTRNTTAHVSAPPAPKNSTQTWVHEYVQKQKTLLMWENCLLDLSLNIGKQSKNSPSCLAFLIISWPSESGHASTSTQSILISNWSHETNCLRAPF